MNHGLLRLKRILIAHHCRRNNELSVRNFKGESSTRTSVGIIICCGTSRILSYYFLGFMGCMGMGILCFSMAAAYLPVLVIAARKFALLYTLGSIFFISSFSLLYGPKKHFKEGQKHTNSKFGFKNQIFA